ncbi:YgjP-like metallopeptidase domain-containing protein [Bifidobacterium sp. ESL0825]|uniref:YgjP-like metallopeptidase domain-containing protein n=1 Tax=Bifidobacterium sp. ESL0825 TaxID=3448587 RepID=UPI004042F96A
MADIRALSSEPFYVEVSAPLRISDRTIRSFVEQRQGWIHAQEQRLKTSLNNRGHGRPIGFEWTPERQAQAQAHIQAQLPDLLEKCQSIVRRSPSHITLRIMTSRWGSCTPETGRIRLNLQLGLMDERFLEYVLIHELTHLWERGHGSGFQSRMDSYLPQWRKLRRELNQQMIW